MGDNQGDVKAALEFAGEHLFQSEVVTVEDDGVSADVLITRSPGGVTTTPIVNFTNPLRTHPRRRKGTIEVDDLDSFIYLVNRDKLPESLIFSGRDTDNAPYIEAVLDFHEPVSVKADEAQPRFCENRIAYGFPLSDEWKVWTSKHGDRAAMGQATFAQFIEDHIFDVGEPGAVGAIAQAFALKLGVTFAGPSQLMAVSRGLEVRAEYRIKETRNLENGDCSVVFETNETDKHGAALNVPSAFHILIPIFKAGALYSIPVRLRRRRTQEGALIWWFELHRADLFLNDAIEDALKRVRAPESAAAASTDGDSTALALPGDAPLVGCGLPVVMGTPPA